MIEARARRAGPDDPDPASRPPRRRRRQDRRPGVHPPGNARLPAGGRGPWADGRQAARLRPRPRMARRRRRRWTATPALAELARRYLRRPRAGLGPRPRQVGGPVPARRPRRPRGDLLGDRGGGGGVGPPARLGRRLVEDAAAAAARRLRPDPGRLVLTRADRRRPRAADRQRRGLSAVRAGRGSRGRGLEMGRGGGRARPAGGPLRPCVETCSGARAADVARFLQI